MLSAFGVEHIHKSRFSAAPSALGRKLPGGKLLKIEDVKPSRHGLRRGEGHSIPNGRGGGEVKIARGSKPEVLRHELAHIAPHRNPVRLAERMKDPVRLGREEGRADFMAYGRAGNGIPRGSQESFKQGYREVQGKMTQAKRKP